MSQPYTTTTTRAEEILSNLSLEYPAPQDNKMLMMQMAELYTQFMLKNVCAMCHEEVHPTHHVKFHRRRYCPECYNRKMKINK